VRRLDFAWRESGVTLDGAAPHRKGFGSELLERTLAYELGAKSTLAFRRDGVECTISLPLTDRIVVSTTP
jgi:two-component system CheB/CheR fusion protein